MRYSDLYKLFTLRKRRLYSPLYKFSPYRREKYLCLYNCSVKNRGIKKIQFFLYTPALSVQLYKALGIQFYEEGGVISNAG